MFGKAGKRRARPFWRPVGFPSAWRQPTIAPVLLQCVRFVRRFPTPGSGEFQPLHGWHGYSPASVFPCGAQAENQPDADPARQYAYAGSAGTALAMPQRSLTALRQCSLLHSFLLSRETIVHKEAKKIVKTAVRDKVCKDS